MKHLFRFVLCTDIYVSVYILRKSITVRFDIPPTNPTQWTEVITRLLQTFININVDKSMSSIHLAMSNTILRSIPETVLSSLEFVTGFLKIWISFTLSLRLLMWFNVTTHGLRAAQQWRRISTLIIIVYLWDIFSIVYIKLDYITKDKKACFPRKFIWAEFHTSVRPLRLTLRHYNIHSDWSVSLKYVFIPSLHSTAFELSPERK